MPLPLTLGPSRALLAMPPAADPLAALRVGLISSWRLQEASGSAVDSVGTNTLTANNSPLTAAGPNGFQARSLVAASTQYFQVASNSTLQTGNIDFTLACWVYLTATGVVYDFYSRYAGSTNGEYLLRRSAGNRFELLAIAQGVGSQTLTNNNTVPGAGTWYLVIAWVDTTAGTVNLQVNADTVSSAAKTVTLAATAQPLALGNRAGGSGGNLDGRLALAAFWKRVLTAGERAALFNGGNGVAL